MIAAERLEKIISFLREKHVVSTSALSEDLEVTEMTIRRDLLELESQGLCQRTHGGAIAAGRSILRETPYRERELQNVKEKRAIAREAALLVHEGETIALDSGTTTLQLARLLKKKRNITVVTNSIHAILELYCCNNIRVISSSGTLSNPMFTGESQGDPCLVGPLAEEILERFRPSKAFIGTSGISLDDGLSNSVMDEASMKRTMMRVSGEAIVLADHTKIGHVASSIVGPISLVDRLITDDKIPLSFLEKIESMGVLVTQAMPE